ncbi:MAG: hypothetical protein CVU56_06050 [Deltaproteobacteria bacterium HGW-Deltaproteobacteria-14]|jgi:hypothetical protein|nr:MAG: hypothetical protein CVU56_06050 [Deltaproteobacteria bacterium HGW-Deltaproteobacteria-14]
MKRLDWHLIRPPRPGAAEVAEIEHRIDELVHRATEKVLDEDELTRLLDLEDLHDERTIATCEAVGAPRVDDDPDWESRTIDEYADTDTDLDLEEYLELRRAEPDCERCPFASVYSLFPLDPCEFAAGGLLQVVTDGDVRRQVAEPMDAGQMVALADALERVMAEGRWEHIVELDAEDYLKKAVFFLRLWARHGFRVRPVATDEEAPILTPDGPIGGSYDDGEPSPLLH